jgi:hypothetical protein
MFKTTTRKTGTAQVATVVWPLSLLIVWGAACTVRRAQQAPTDAMVPPSLDGPAMADAGSDSGSDVAGDGAGADGREDGGLDSAACTAGPLTSCTCGATCAGSCTPLCNAPAAGICRDPANGTCDCGVALVDNCVKPGTSCLCPSCGDAPGALCVTDAQRAALCSGPAAGAYRCN